MRRGNIWKWLLIKNSLNIEKKIPMNKIAIYLKQIFPIGICIILLSCQHPNQYASDNQLPDPIIKAGIAKISGTVTNLILPQGEKKATIEIFVKNPVTAEERKYVADLNENNRFSLEIPLEISTAIVGFNVGSETKYYCSGMLGLAQDKDLQLNIAFNDKDGYNIEVQGGLNLTVDDIMNIGKAVVRFDTLHTWGYYYKMTPEEFAKHELTVSLKERANFAIDSLPLSEKIKKYMVNDLNLHFLKGRLFFYREDTEKSFIMSQQENPFYAPYTAVEPDKSYYTFLRQFDLNNPQYLYCFFYTDFMKKFLTIAPFKIPTIKDKPIDEWLKEVKAAVKDAVGFDSGLFYDMLVANAYACQLNDKKEPLTNTQAENIKNYYKNKNEEFTKILLKKNEEIIKIVEHSKDLKVNVTPAVTKEKLMDSIIAKYKGSPVLVDLWATWCGPCLNAMREMNPLKAELKYKGVVFVYLTNSSSPKPEWEGKIKGIGGNHFYLADNEWNYLMENFGFKGIPSYLIYDKKGLLKHQFTSYPGNDKMREMIEALLR